MIRTPFRGRRRTVMEINAMSGVAVDTIRKHFREGKRGEDLVLDRRRVKPATQVEGPVLTSKEQASIARRAREQAKRETLKAQIRELL